jgi:hypothetical protein
MVSDNEHKDRILKHYGTIVTPVTYKNGNTIF